MTRLGVPFLATLPVAFVVAALVGVVLERTLYQRLYSATHLDQVLFSIGLVFMSIAGATYFFGPSQQPVQLPEFLRGQVHVLGLDLGAYRLFLIARRRRAHRRAALSDRAHALRRAGARLRRQRSRPPRASASTSTACSRSPSRSAPASPASAARSASTCSGSIPTFPLKYMVYFLLVVAVGGAGTIKGPLVAALHPRRVRRRRQVLRAAGRRLRHLRADGRAADRCSRRACSAGAHERQRSTLPSATAASARSPAVCRAIAGARSRSRSGCCRSPRSSCCPTTCVLGSQILIVGLFAVSLDLILGYAGIVSLGHAAFFGLGAYTAGLLAVHGWGEPLSGLARRGGGRGARRLRCRASSSCAAAT